MKRLLLTLLVTSMCAYQSQAQKYTYNDSWDQGGYTLKNQSQQGITLNYSIREFTMNDLDVRGESMKQISLPGHFLPGDEGAPDLPGSGRYIAVPQGARPVLHIKSVRKEIYTNVNISPAPRIPKTTEDGPLNYNKNIRIYNHSDFYPAEPFRLSEMTTVRGVDAVILGITPFQYNPVKGELIVYRDIELEVEFTGSNGQFGDERYRSRWWDPILEDIFVNAASLPKVDYSKRIPGNNRTTGYEYLIICPDDPVFISWADSVRVFRTMQGIHTGVVTTTQAGGNNAAAIENYVNNAYQTWDIPPAAVLLLGDYGTFGSTIDSPIWDNYCVSDHIYADVNGDDEEEMVFARMTARNAAELEVMIRKAIDYERNPPTNPGFYDHPITALGWQTERWFQICSETVGGYFRNVQGKDPVRINAVYGGNPNVDPWSTAPNTNTVLGVFGPGGLGYIPATPAELGGWTGGTATQVNNALNSGAFILQHRDHGGETGWGEPDYQNNNINGLTNTDLSFIFSINCLTGKYNYGQECFAEKFHRYTYNGQPAGALGLLAASEVSYSFVNDAFVWGVFDNMFPDFLPLFGTTPDSRGMLPAFGNAAGKYFLKYSSWPYNTGNKEVTYNLFHHHGDAFTCLYSEVPQDLAIVHDPVQMAGVDYFTIQANAGALIALSVNGELIGVGTGTGIPANIPIIAQVPPTIIDLVVTKENYYRYQAQISVIPPDGPFVVLNSHVVNDAAGNANGLLDYGETVALDISLKNVGNETAENVMLNLASASEFITISNNSAEAGTILPDQTIEINDVFSFAVSTDVPDGYNIPFTLEASNNDTVWVSNMSIRANSPSLEYNACTISDINGNNNGRLDPGETVELTVVIKNKGGADAYFVHGFLHSLDAFIEIEADSAMFGDIPANSTASQIYTISALPITPPGHMVTLSVDLHGEFNIMGSGEFTLNVGLFPILVLDLDGNHNSGNKLMDAIEEWNVFAEYSQAIPSDISHYNTIFICLGTYPGNYILTQSTTAPFIDFLNNGGNLYMEGPETWYYDQTNNPTTLHPMFNIQGLSDGSGDLSTIAGVAGTFTEGMSFVFNGDNSYIDRISPIIPAFRIFSNQSPVYHVAVAYDAGNYKTIGSSFEFGGLLDNVSNTKKDLMLKYMEFFGMEPITEAPSIPEGDTEICGTEVPANYSTQAIAGADYYIWSIDPPNAGTIEGWGTEVLVYWTLGFQGTASLSVCGMNQTGMGPFSENLSIQVHELPTATLSFTATTLCQGDTTYMDVNMTGISPWHIEMSIGGTVISFDSDLPTIEDIPLFPLADMEIIVLSLTDNSGCINSDFEPLYISVISVPETPGIPSGPDFVDIFATTQSEYITLGSLYSTNYEWSMEPSSAGSLSVSEDGMTATMLWSPEFFGLLNLKVKGLNDCGEGAFSDALVVNVFSTVGITDPKTGIGIVVYPNPSNGIFTLELHAESGMNIIFRLLNTAGETVWGPYEAKVNKRFTMPVNLNSVSEGMYMLQIENDKGISHRKILIRK